MSRLFGSLRLGLHLSGVIAVGIPTVSGLGCDGTATCLTDLVDASVLNPFLFLIIAFTTKLLPRKFNNGE